MYITKHDPEVNAPPEYIGLKAQSAYLFPYFVRYIAWFLIVTVVISSCVVLILYGMAYGMLQLHLWLITAFGSFFITMFISPPIKIFISSLLNVFFLKKKPSILSRKIYPFLLSNPDNPEKKKKVLKYRQLNAHLYAPTPFCKLQDRLEDIKYNLQLRNLILDFIVHACFIMTVLSIVQCNKPEMGYYSTETIKNLVVKGNYTKSMPFSEVKTYETFMQYLKETLLPALLLNHAEFNDSDRNRRRRSPQDVADHAPPPRDVRKRQILDDFAGLENDTKTKGGEAIFDKGWTMSPGLKLLGKPRLRQLRVRTETCKRLVHSIARNPECAPDLTPFNVERGEFTLGWNPGPPKGLTTSQASPWTYRSALESQSFPIYGKFSTYPGGGYILGLARDIRDARVVLDFLDTFQWVDMRTRAVFVEFALYCANTNLFSVVTLIVEKTASGYIIPSYQVDTSQFIFTDAELEYMYILMTFSFGCFLVFFITREGIRIQRTTLVPYLKRGFAWVDLGFILLSLVSFFLMICRMYYVGQLLKQLEMSNNNEFVSFIYAVTWHNWSTYMEALLICFSSIKLFRLLAFRVVFFQLQTILSHCYKYFVGLFFEQMVLIFAFALFFNLTLARYSYRFSSFDVSLSSMIWRAVSLDDNFEFRVFVESPWYIGQLFFGVFVIIVIILFVNMFIAIICLYYRQIREVSFLNKYNVLEYIKHMLTFKKQSDILLLKEGKPSRGVMSDPTVMRLKGGGSKWSKKKKKTPAQCKKRNVKKRSHQEPEEQLIKAKYKDFVVKKPYDTTEYRDLVKERNDAMRHLVLMITSRKDKTKKCAKEKALMALFCSLSAAKAKAGRYRTACGRYFFGAEKSEKRVYDAARFFEMKRIIEDMAREKCWLEDEERMLNEMNAAEDRLSVLNEKLCLLIRKEKHLRG